VWIPTADVEEIVEVAVVLLAFLFVFLCYRLYKSFVARKLLVKNLKAAGTELADTLTVQKAPQYRATKCCGRVRYVKSTQTVVDGHLEKTARGCGPCTWYDAEAAQGTLKRSQARAFKHATGCTDPERVEFYLWGKEEPGTDSTDGGVEKSSADGDVIEAIRRFWRDFRKGVPGLKTSMTEEGEVWIENVSRATPDEMRAMQEALVEGEELSEKEMLAFHFTSVASAQLIFGAGSVGIRASSVGIGGAGVYVCPTPLHLLGWEMYGGNSWRERVGRALWGENWNNVLLGERDADKIEVVLVMKVAKSIVSQYTQERPHAAVLKRRLLVNDGGHGWFPRCDIVKVWGLTNDHEAAAFDDMRSAFEKADKDSSGNLSREEVVALLTERGLNCSDGYVDGIFESYDADQSGTIDYSEFELLSKMVARRLANGGGRTTPSSILPGQQHQPMCLHCRGTGKHHSTQVSESALQKSGAFEVETTSNPLEVGSSTATRRKPPSLAGLVAASVVVRKRPPPPALPDPAQAEEQRRQQEARTEAEQAAVVAKSERELFARKAALRRERLASAGREM